MADIVDALKDLATQNPEKAGEVLDQLKEKWASMTDEQKAAAKEQFGALKEKVAGMSDEQRTAIAEKISSFGA